MSQASGLTKEDEPRQVNTLLYCLGEESDDVLASNITEESKKKYATFLEKVDVFFQVRKNVIFERARFNRCNHHGELIEQYITALYHLVDSCEYGALKEEMLWDSIVVGIETQENPNDSLLYPVNPVLCISPIAEEIFSTTYATHRDP